MKTNDVITSTSSVLENPATQFMKLRLPIARILVPIDFSPCSIKALQYAIPIAKQFGSRLFLLYVGQGYYPVPVVGPEDMQSIRASVSTATAVELAEVGKSQAGGEVPVAILTRNGYPPEQIEHAARDVQADLIVISTHGYSGLKHTWFGSVAESVARRASCPVLIVHQRETACFSPGTTETKTTSLDPR